MLFLTHVSIIAIISTAEFRGEGAIAPLDFVSTVRCKSYRVRLDPKNTNVRNIKKKTPRKAS